MRAVILAAGEGSRLRPYTDSRPKCLVSLAGETLIEHQRTVLRKCGVTDVTVVTGYRGQQVAEKGFTVVENPAYRSTNMVASLWCASDVFDGSEDVLVTYGDIVYEPQVLQSLAGCRVPLAITVDRNWHTLWKARMEDPLADAETLLLAEDGKVIEIGRPPEPSAVIEGQYMGLVKIAASFAKPFADLMQSLQSAGSLKSRTWGTLDMTTFLQHLINSGHPVQAVPVEGGWLEVDSARDLETYRRLYQEDQLHQFWQPEAA